MDTTPCTETEKHVLDSIVTPEGPSNFSTCKPNGSEGNSIISGTTNNTPMLCKRVQPCVFQKQNNSSHKGDIGSIMLALDSLDSMSRTALFVVKEKRREALSSSELLWPLEEEQGQVKQLQLLLGQRGSQMELASQTS